MGNSITANLEKVRNWLSSYGETTLSYKWSVSRGRDTYGYNICTLYADGLKVATCNGGGYDMMGTCLGEFVTEIWRGVLEMLAEENAVPNENNNGFSSGEEYGCYGLYSYNRKLSGINGACGFSSVITILDKLGWELKEMRTHNRKEHTYLLRRKEV